MLSEKLRKLAEELKRKNSLEYLTRQQEIYGIIYADYDTLKYGIWENKRLRKNYELDIPHKNLSIFSVFATENEVYSDCIGKPKKLFDQTFNPSERINTILSFQKYENRILDAGASGLFDTETGEQLISKESMNAKDIISFDSLEVDKNGNLYALVFKASRTHSIIKINKDYSIGNEIYSWGVTPDIFSKANIVRFPEDKDGLLIVSCVYASCLDINKDIIRGTRISGSQEIRSLHVLSCSEKELEVIYSGHNLGSILYKKIDLESREIVDESTAKTGLSERVNALETVRSPELHNKLIEKGKLID